jgi:diadenosine tetraphosphate (Ap4A) HIT family hydrolase
MNNSGVAKRFAKNEDYKKTLEAIEQTDKCPFCPDNFKYHKKPILKEFQGWMATENSWPYTGTKHHFIFIAKEHKDKFQDLTDQDFQAIRYLINWIIDEYKIPGGGLTLRFGEQTYTGATVRHLHFHLIVPDLNPETKLANTINFAIG